MEGLVYTEELFVQTDSNFSEKELVAVSDSPAVEAPRYLHFVHYIVNKSQIIGLSLCCARFDEVATICANV